VAQRRSAEARENWEAALASKDRAIVQLETALASRQRAVEELTEAAAGGAEAVDLQHARIQVRLAAVHKEAISNMTSRACCG
jgi:hypothetical protein